MNKIQKFAKIFPAMVVMVMLFNLALPFTVYAQDVTTPTETPAAPVVVDTPTEIPPETPMEIPTDVEPVVDPTQVAEVILTEVPAGTDLVVVDTTGDPIPLDSQDAAQIIAAVDPMWCPEGALPNDPGCTTNMSTTDLLADMRANPDKYASSGVIYFDNTAPVTLSFALNDATDSLGIAYNALNSFNLSMFGGWNGGSTNTFSGQTEFNGSNAFITIGSLANPWLGSVALNNIRVSGNQTQSSGIEINASNVDLTNVDSTYNAGNGITVNADQPGTVNLNNVTTTNNGEGIPGSTSSGVLINGNDTNVNVNGGNFDNNAGFGIDANDSNSTSIPQGNAWTDALDYAPGSVVTLSGNDNRLNGQNQGFTPGETVHVVVSGPNGYTAECDGVADAIGGWTCQISLWASDLAIGDYTYTANGLSSGIHVEGNFTDGRTINWVTLNGGSIVNVLPGASIAVSINVSTSGNGSGTWWQSTEWSIGPNSWGTYICAADTMDFTVAGTNTATFSITVPSSILPGTYNAYFYAWSGANCNGGDSNRYDLFSSVVVVVKTSPTITWANPADITYPTALSATQLNATASVPGTFAYTPVSGTVLNAGNSQTLHVYFTPSDTSLYSIASKDVTINVLKADATCTIDGYTGIYDGAAHGAGGSCSGTGSLDLDSIYIDFPGGTANWTYTGGINFNDQDGSVVIDIIKADASCTVTPYSVTYDSGSHTATGSCTGVGGPSNILSGLDLSGTTHTNAGTYDDTWTFSDVTGNYNGTGDMVGDFINPADATCTINGYTGTYDGTSHGATGSCTGISGADLSGSLDLGDTFKNVPGDIAFWYFSDGSGNYSDQNGDVIIEIDPAEANCTVTPYSVTYDDSSHTATGSCTGVGGPSDILSGLDLSGTTHTNANTYTDIWTFSDVTGNYNNTEDMVSNLINPADATCTVTPYSVTYDGSSHTATGSCTGVGGPSDILSGLDISGTTHTDADTYPDTWTFADVTGNYNNTSDSINDSISEADATCTINGFTGAYDGAVHGATGSCSGTGILDLGLTFTEYPGGTAHWTYSGGTNYNDQSGSVAITVNKATSTVTVTCPSVPQTYTGLAQTPCSAEATGMGMIALDVSASLLYADNTNVGTATVSASWGGESNHTGNTGSGSFSISQAAGSVSINNIPVSAEYGGSFNPTFNLLGDGTPSAASLTSGICTVTSGVVNYVGVGTCTLQASVTAGTNYLAATGAPQSFTVVDTTAPELTLPANIILVAAGPLGATVNYVATALDQVDGAVPVNCVPASGSTFAIGTTTVNCSASDSHENINSGSFTITVQPRGTTTPPIFPPPQPTLLIPVTGGQPVNLVCGSWSTLRTPHGIKVEFLSVLCGYQVSLAEEQAETLPGTLTGTFHHGITLQILSSNNPLDLVPENAFVRISFPMPENSKVEDYSVMYWNVALNNGIGGWMELPLTTGKLNPDNNLDVRQVLSGLQIVNGFAQITVNFPGTFVIVKK